jgi:serine/threonine protein kinase
MPPAADEPATAAPTGEWTCSTCGGRYPNDFAVCPRDATPRADKISRTDALIGEVIGRTYRITRMLGEGGMARLYEAVHLRTETRYAVKILHADLARDADQLARFEREARVAARISSDHVVRLVDVLRTADDRPCLIEELLEGEDLQAMLDRVKRLEVAVALPIARQICRAITAAHAAGVVHRDLKPSNVFLCKREGEPPIVKVFDFGVAKLADDERLTRTDAVMGTAAYMAPEQARRAVDAGPLADVYSAGAVLYHMVTGEPPYGNVPAVSRFALVLHEEPARPSSIAPTIPPAVEAVIQHAMARELAARFQSAAELEAQLAALDKPAAAPSRPSARLSSQPSATTDTASVDLARRARHARPVAAAIAAASSVAAGAWIAGLLATVVAPSSSGESGLIALIALGAITGVAMLHAKILKARWNSAPAVMRYTRPIARGLAAGVATLGALDLFAYITMALLGVDLLHPGGRIVGAGLAAAIGLGWERWALDERVRRRMS